MAIVPPLHGRRTNCWAGATKLSGGVNVFLTASTLALKPRSSL
jgi:hypothetical protein